MEDSQFYQRLKQVCEVRGVRISHIPEKVGLSIANLGKWKHGGYPSADILQKMSEELHCSVDFLLGITENMFLDIKNASLDTKEALRLALVGEGIIPPNRPMTVDERAALLAFAETYFKRLDK